jgi:hypothetical protein
MSKRKTNRTMRYALVIRAAGQKVKIICYNSLRALREKYQWLLSTLPSCDWITVIRRTDGFVVTTRRGCISPS